MRRFGRTPKRIARGWKVAMVQRIEGSTQLPIEQDEGFNFADLPHYLNELRRVHGRNRKELAANDRLVSEFPVIYQWSDGSVVCDEDGFNAWDAEVWHRYNVFVG